VPVLQRGGPIDENDTDPALHLGERVVLFLAPAPASDPAPPGVYTIVDGGVGQWTVQADDTVDHHRPWPTELGTATTLAAFLEQVLAA
jgi:hypothetical protein